LKEEEAGHEKFVKKRGTGNYLTENSREWGGIQGGIALSINRGKFRLGGNEAWEEEVRGVGF